MSAPVVRSFGDRAILVEFDDELSPLVNGKARALARAMYGNPGVLETVPALRSVLIVIDPLDGSRDAVTAAAIDLAPNVAPEATVVGRDLEVPVVYGGEAGPDLGEVAATLGLSAQELIEVHSKAEYTVYMLGFTPGFPYLGLLPEGLRVSRLATPRTRVPVGSVAIADELSGIYPSQTPGGWRLIGRTPLPVYDPALPDPILFRPGDRVRFVAATHAVFPVEQAVPQFRRPVHPVLEVLEPGLFTTVQDLGRPGYRHLGMPGSGAIDRDAFRVANILVGNDPGAPAIECTAPGPVIRMLVDRWVVVTGADLTATLDGAEIEPGQPVQLHSGQEIRFGAPRAGNWAYLAFAGGIDVPSVLGSASAFPAGRVGRRLARGDILGVRRARERSTKAGVPSELMHIPPDEISLRVIPGPQEAWFVNGAGGFYNSAFRVTVQSDRAGIRLDGPAISRVEKEMRSDAMLPGAIQVPQDGKPIVISADGPTTGGYPKIGVVATVDLPLLGQAQPGTRVRFVRTTVEAAVDALRSREALFVELRDKGRRGEEDKG